MKLIIARIVSIVVLVIAIPLRLNPRVVLPSGYSWSGDFMSSEWGMRVAGFADLMNLFIAAALLLLVLSCTNLMRD